MEDDLILPLKPLNGRIYDFSLLVTDLVIVYVEAHCQHFTINGLVCNTRIVRIQYKPFFLKANDEILVE